MINHPLCQTCKKTANKGPLFHQTTLGRRYIEGNIPELSRNISELTNALENIEVEVSPTVKSNIQDIVSKIANLSVHDNFFQTQFGSRYYSSLIPNLSRNIKALTTEIKSLNDPMQKNFAGTFFGLLDSAGKEIKVGDRVRFKTLLYPKKDFEGKVVYNQTSCSFRIDRGCEEGFNFDSNIFEIEII